MAWRACIHALARCGNSGGGKKDTKSTLCQHISFCFCRDDNGRTALHWAAASDHPQICRQLISAAQKQVAAAAAATAHHPSTTSIDSEDPRSHASVQERASMHDISGSWDVDASPVPLNRGGCTSIGGVHNMSPGAAAAASANAPKPLICLPDDRGNTAVHIAARDACCNALNELLVAVASHTHAHHAQHTHDHADAVTGASEASGSHASDAQHDHSVLLIKNKAGQTALHCAVLGGSAACISALVAAAPVTTEATDRLGATPRQVAIQRGCSSEILATLGPHACEGAAANSLSRAHAEGGCMGAPAKGGSAPMLLVTSPDCLAHHTAKPPVLRGVSIPPENIRRLEVRPTHPQNLPESSENFYASQSCHLASAGFGGSADRNSEVWKVLRMYLGRGLPPSGHDRRASSACMEVRKGRARGVRAGAGRRRDKPHRLGYCSVQRELQGGAESGGVCVRGGG